MSTYTVEVRGKSYSVHLQSRRGTLLTFIIDGQEYEAAVIPTPASLGRSLSNSTGSQSTSPAATLGIPQVQARPSATAATELIAPIPGIVSDIKISEGQEIKAGDVALVLEAMKMENPIKAHRSGTVTKVHVSRGQEVAHGAALVSIE